MTSCQRDRQAIMGIYNTHYYEEHADFSDMDCSLELDMREDFGWSTVENSTKMALTFHFSEPFEFPSMRLEYEATFSGKWDVNGDTLSVLLGDNVDGIKYTFLKSNAKTPTEESMVRNIRGMLAKDFKAAKNDPDKLKFILKYCNSKAIIKSNTETEMTLIPLEQDKSKLIVKKKGE